MASHGRVILLAQQKGGAGKTTLATQLAVAMVSQGRRVQLVDLDPQRSATNWYTLRCELRGNGDGLEVVESAEWRARSDLLYAARSADLVFVDAPGAAGALGRGAMRSADFALIPCQPSAADVWASNETLEMARQEKIPHAFVLNRVPPKGRVADAAVATLMETGAPILPVQIGSRLAFAEAFMLGAGVTEIARRSAAAKEINALAEALDLAAAHA